MPRAPRTIDVEPGSWDFQSRCPECDSTVTIPITLDTRLTVTSEGGVLRMRVTQQPAEHNCRQPQLPNADDPDQSELPDDAEATDDEPEF